MITGTSYLSFKQTLYFPGLGNMTRTRTVKSRNSSAKCGCFCMFEIIRAEQGVSFLGSVIFTKLCKYCFGISKIFLDTKNVSFLSNFLHHSWLKAFEWRVIFIGENWNNFLKTEEDVLMSARFLWNSLGKTDTILQNISLSTRCSFLSALVNN